MLFKLQSFHSIMLLNIFLLALLAPTHGLATRKLQQDTVPGGEKCTPCNPSPPPPPPLCPPPPPQAPPPPPPPVLPPPSPKKPPSGYCPPPPPPPSSIIYITGPPGSLYPIDNDFGGSSRVSGLPVLIGCGLLMLLVRFGF